MFKQPPCCTTFYKETASTDVPYFQRPPPHQILGFYASNKISTMGPIVCQWRWDIKGYKGGRASFQGYGKSVI